MEPRTINSALLGLAVGDTLGVPVEFKSREYLRENPVIGYDRLRNLQPATWNLVG